jgi:hypothetical protein
MKTTQTYAACLMMALIAFSAAVAQLAGPPSYDLSWHTLDGGGATFSTGGGFELGGTIGQHDAGPPGGMTGGGFQLVGGFWAGGGGGEPVDPCPPDITGDLLINVDDLLAVIGSWGDAGGPADINDDNIVNVNDLLAVIGAWGACP